MKKLLSLALVLTLMFCLCPAAHAATDEAVAAAEKLYELGLFIGSGSNPDGTPNFALDRTPTREEAVTMLVRLLGKEDEAKAQTWSNAFTDVSPWAAPYVGYAYANGLTNGIKKDGTLFGGGAGYRVNAAQFITFVLRALGYSDAEGDFRWDYPWLMSDPLGLTHGQYDYDRPFTRGDAAIVCAAALEHLMKGTNTTLLQSLFSAGAITKKGALRVTSSPAGADVYVDGEFSEKTAPCTLLLAPGEHEISLVIPGYEDCFETVTVEAGKEAALTQTVLPALPEATVITVNSEKDEELDYELDRSISVDDLTGETTLRMAVLAAEHDTSDTMYRIEFEENVKHITMLQQQELYRGNLIINGDRDRDGTPDVALSMTGIGQGLHFCDGDNIYLCGLRFEGLTDPFAFKPDDNATWDISMENLYVLGCDCNWRGLIGIGGVCKEYNSSGTVNYKNINFCGNTVTGGDVFFSCNGNCDDSLTDGIRYCANTLSDDSCMTVITSDCNTWYIYGGDTVQGNGGTPGAFETSDGNTVRNVLISGNTGGRIVLGAGTNGNSHNMLEDVVVRNNVVTGSLFIRPAQLFDEGNVGNTLVTSGNVIENLRVENNVIDCTNAQQDFNCFIWVCLLACDRFDPSSTNIADDNVIRDLSFVGNRMIGFHDLDNPVWFIENGISYSLLDGVVCASVGIVGDENGDLRYRNNRYENLCFSGNRSIERWDYDPYAP